jgi:hypothetical protein
MISCQCTAAVTDVSLLFGAQPTLARLHEFSGSGTYEASPRNVGSILQLTFNGMLHPSDVEHCSAHQHSLLTPVGAQTYLLSLVNAQQHMHHNAQMLPSCNQP